MGGIAVSCSKTVPSNSDDIKSVTFSFDGLSIIDEDPSTKTSIDASNNIIWAAGDTVGIYPNKGAQVYFVTNPGEDARIAKFDGGGWNFKAESTYSCYYPFIGNFYLDRTNIPVSFVGQKQGSTSSISHIGKHHYFYTDAIQAVNGTLNFAFHHLCCVIRPNVTLPAGTYTKLAITAPSKVFVKKGHYNLAAGNCAIIADEKSNQIQIELDNITLTNETTFRVYLTSAPVDLKGVEITVSVLNSQKKELQCKKTPSSTYTAGTLAGLTCNSWTEVPQSMGMIISDWGDGGNITGDAE